MADEIRRLIRVRNEKGATFKRDGFGKKKQLSSSWRKPRGQHNKQREQKKAKGNLPKPGFGSPIGVRGMHPSGFFDVLVHTADDLAGLDPKTQAIRIASTVGSRKRSAIQQAALSAGLRVLNARAAQPVKKPEPAREAEEKPQEQKKKKAAAPKAKPVAEKAPEQPEATKESKKAPKEPAPKKVKEAKKPKPAEATEPAQAAEESKKKEQKPKAKAKAKAGADAKPTKAAASKAGPAKEAKPAKKATAKPKKKTSSGVNNNE